MSSLVTPKPSSLYSSQMFDLTSIVSMFTNQMSNLTKQNQVMFFYVLVLLLSIIIGVIFVPKLMSTENMIGGIYGFIFGMLFCQVLYIFVGYNYIHSDDKPKSS